MVEAGEQEEGNYHCNYPFGFIATVGTFVGLYKSKWYRIFSFGLLNILLVALNNYVYYTKGLIVYLPVIQKISFATFLIWICCIDMKLYLETEKNKELLANNTQQRQKNTSC